MKLIEYLKRNYYEQIESIPTCKRPSGAPLHTLSKF